MQHSSVDASSRSSSGSTCEIEQFDLTSIAERKAESRDCSVDGCGCANKERLTGQEASKTAQLSPSSSTRGAYISKQSPPLRCSSRTPGQQSDCIPGADTTLLFSSSTSLRANSEGLLQHSIELHRDKLRQHSHRLSHNDSPPATVQQVCIQALYALTVNTSSTRD
jgi:hypothetical protein